MGIPDHLTCLQGFPGSSDGKASAYNAEDLGSIPMSGRSPGEGNGNPLQYSCLENPVDRGAWWAAAHRVTKSRARLSDFTSLHLLTRLLRSLCAGQEATVRTRHGTTDWFHVGKRVRQGCILSLCCLTYMQSTSCKMPGWMKHKLESRLPRKISITSDMQMTPP